MADTEDGVASIATQDSLDKDEEKFLPVSRDDEKAMPIDSDQEEIVTTTKVSSITGDQYIQQRTTKVTKTTKVVKKIKKTQKYDDETDEEEEEIKETVSITELSDDEKYPESSIPQSAKAAQHITSVCSLFLFCLYTHKLPFTSLIVHCPTIYLLSLRYITHHVFQSYFYTNYIELYKIRCDSSWNRRCRNL